MNTDQHHRYMSLALRLAERGRLTVSPNPMVGCVIVKNNQVIGEGYHQRAGGPHAEIIALKQAGKQSQGACAYVTLEPCCHYGQTPPCTTALIAAGIKKVYVACIDPNPLVAGHGIQALRAAGIQVETGCCEKEAIALNEIFIHYMINKRPFVIAKWAMSLDGKTRVNQADNKQISCPASQSHTHALRQQVDAILVGANTVMDDNPQLTARETTGELKDKQPIRVILSGHQTFPPHLKLFTQPYAGKTLIAVTLANKHLFAELTSEHVELLVCQQNDNMQLSLPSLLDELAKKKITSLLVEGGMTVHESFLQAKLVNKIHVYLSPVIIGNAETKQAITLSNYTQKGEDLHVIAHCKEIENV